MMLDCDFMADVLSLGPVGAPNTDRAFRLRVDGRGLLQILDNVPGRRGRTVRLSFLAIVHDGVGVGLAK